MKTMKWLIRREFYEHRGMFIWAPLVVAAVITTLIAIGIFTGVGEVKDGGTSYRLLSDAERVKLILNTAYMAAFFPLFLMSSFTSFFYCLGTLFDERRDRSFLFWKSLPVSDSVTVVSKMLTVIVCVPLITFLIAAVVSFVLMFLMCLNSVFKGYALFGPLLSTPALYLTPLQIFAFLPAYIFWAVPTLGWLFLVSSWARSKVFLWAVGTPLLTIAIIKILTTAYHLDLYEDWAIKHVIFRGINGLIPGIWRAYEQFNPTALNELGLLDLGPMLQSSWLSLTSPDVWVGAACGVAMIIGAIHMRRWREEA